jgi:4'-phosphopantetheinyl transferase
LLGHAERTRWARFRRAEDRERYLVAHALARIVLGFHLGVAPDRIAFSTVCQRCGGAHGKPRLRGHAERLELSISHSGQRVAVAVARRTPVGVDVEETARGLDSASLGRAVLSSAEQAVLDRLPPADRAQGLLTYWTRKEALLKATGDGLAIPPASLTVTGLGEPPQLRAWTGQPQLVAPAHLYDLHPGPGHIACLAVLATAGPRIVELDAGEQMLS